MLKPCPAFTPLAAAEAAIERAAVAAWRRHGKARSMGAQLSAYRILGAIAEGLIAPTACHDPGTALELARLAGMQAVGAAAADDDMRALRAELMAALDALASA